MSRHKMQPLLFKLLPLTQVSVPTFEESCVCISTSYLGTMVKEEEILPT